MKKLILSFIVLAMAAGVNAQSLSGDFETWRTVSAGGAGANLEAPQNWYGIDSLVYTFGSFAGVTPKKMLFKDDMKPHTGTYAAKLISRDLGGQAGVVGGVLVNAMPTFDIFKFDPSDPLAAVGYEGGTPVTQRILFVNSWVDYLPKGIDRGGIVVQAVLSGQGAGGEDSVVGQGGVFLQGNLIGYTQEGVYITYDNSTAVPDKIIIVYQSSVIANASQPADSSTLYVDDVTISTVGIDELPEKLQGFVVYPSPSNGNINLMTSKEGIYIWKAYDMAGREVISQKFSGKANINATHLPNGMYSYTLIDEQAQAVANGKINIVH